VQIALPSIMAFSHQSGFNPSLYMCNITRTPNSEAAKAQLADIFAAAGKVLPNDESPDLTPEHCSHCVAPSLMAVPTPLFTANMRVVPPVKTVFTPASFGFNYHPQGPPLGGRAPPHFV